MIHSFTGSAACLIDGTLFGFNPSLCSVVEAGRIDFETCSCPAISDMFLVSIGTGKDEHMEELDGLVERLITNTISRTRDVSLSSG